MKGIILAGGHGTRLYPLTNVISKQLLPVYDKPMIYYPLSTLMLGGIKDIAIISTPEDLPFYKSLLGSGSKLGIKFTYVEQSKPRGLADAFLVCEEFIGGEKVVLILGDNIFHGNLRLQKVFDEFNDGATIFGYAVKDPERYGIIEFDANGAIVGLEEKPKNPKSKYAVPGLYLYDNNVIRIAKELKPSLRGELEITDLNKVYLQKGNLNVQIFGRGVAWLDSGTTNSLQDASHFVQAIEARQSYKISCPEEVAARMGFLDSKTYLNLVKEMPSSEYKKYLIDIYDEIQEINRTKQKAISGLQK